MKKILLSAIVAASAISMTATPSQVWKNSAEASFSAGKAVYNAGVTFDSKGAVIAAGAYNNDFSIAGSNLEAIGTSAYIAKYAADGQAAWAVGIIGSATINKIVTDSNDNIIVAGQFADEITFGTTSGDEIIKDGMTLEGDPTVEQNSAFIAKYSADGKVLAVRSFIPEVQPDLIALIDDWENDLLYWYTDGDIAFKITDLQAVGDNVYASAVYTGITKVEDLTFDSSYVTYLGFMVCDNQCAAVVSLDSNLDNIKVVDQITSTVNNGDYTEDTYEVWNARFDISGNDMIVAYTGTGALSYQGGVIDLMIDDEDNVSPVFIFSTFKNGQFTAKKVTPTASSMINSFNAVSGVKIIGDNAFIAGHQYTVTVEKKDDEDVKTYTNDAFVATIPAMNVENTAFSTFTIMDGNFYYQTSGAAFTAAGEIYIPTIATTRTLSTATKKANWQATASHTSTPQTLSLQLTSPQLRPLLMRHHWPSPLSATQPPISPSTPTTLPASTTSLLTTAMLPSSITTSRASRLPTPPTVSSSSVKATASRSRSSADNNRFPSDTTQNKQGAHSSK